MHRLLASYTFPSSSSLALRGTRKALPLQPTAILSHSNTNTSTSTISTPQHNGQQQQRNHGTKKPLFLRGKRGFKYYEKLKREKEMSDMAKMEYLRQKELTKTIQWKPETEVEKHYVKMMMDLQTSHRKLSERALLRLLDETKDRSDLQFVLRLYRLLRIRHARFSTDLTTKLVEVLERLEDFETVNWILKYPVELDLPPTRAIVYKVMNQYAEKEQYDDVLDLYKNISTGKYMLKLTDSDMSLVTSIFTKSEQYDKILEAYNTKVKRKYRKYEGQMSQTYRDLLKACEQTEDLETAAKIRTEIFNNTAESDETKQSILTEFSDFLAKIDVQATESETPNEAAEEQKEE